MRSIHFAGTGEKSVRSVQDSGFMLQKKALFRRKRPKSESAGLNSTLILLAICGGQTPAFELKFSAACRGTLFTGEKQILGVRFL